METGKAGQEYALAEACIYYFRECPVFEKVLRGFWEKYLSYGTFSGTVTLRDLTDGEREDLEGFFQKNYHGQKSVSISAARFQKALAESRFGGLQPKDLLELYFQEELIGKKEQREREANAWKQVLCEVQTRYAGTPAADWLADVQEGRNGAGAWVQREYRASGKDGSLFGKMLQLGARIINGFPFWKAEYEYVAVFAAQLTGNPHAFDRGTKEESFLKHLIQWMIGKQQMHLEGSALFHALQMQQQYFAVGLLVDDISNYVMVSGVRAWTRAGTLHRGMEGFLAEGDTVQVSLSVLVDWKQAVCLDGEIYVVENPSIYAMLCRKWKGKRACMCLNGHPRLSGLFLLDLLAKTGTKVYYAGDFDPEGLLIAQKLKQYYKGPFVYWHMSVAEYEGSKSNEQISSRRMKMLDGITDEELIELVQELKTAQVAGYQEKVAYW
ncbi:MAG: DUF2399 domain-containing protein [Lachnospiraceae bacterium]|nr:DUF2399 domain-containing protein [Lachnospiraceae bacterium]